MGFARKKVCVTVTISRRAVTDSTRASSSTSRKHASSFPYKTVHIVPGITVKKKKNRKYWLCSVSLSLLYVVVSK